MAGILGLVAPRDHRDPYALRLACSRLCHSGRFSSEVIVDSEAVWLAGVTRGAGPLSVHVCETNGLTVARYGHLVIKRSGWHALNARELGSAYRERGARLLDEVDGSFAIVIVDHGRGQLLLATDRTASLPVHYSSGHGGFAFAPEAKAVFPLLDRRPALDAEAAVAFLNCGYPLGDRTQFEDVRLLGPGRILTVDLATGAKAVDDYWRLRFEPDRSISRTEAVERLNCAVLEAHSASLADSPPTVRLLLTGGYDSRTVLGALRELGRLPDEALTWGQDDGLPGSDPEIAKELAASAGVPFRFLAYDGHTLPTNAREWCRVSELASDNLGNFAAGKGFLDRECTPGDLILIGDQMIGPGGMPLGIDDALEAATKVPREGVVRALGQLLSTHARRDFGDSFTRQLDALAQRADADDPKDIQDWLYLHLYVYRWLHAPAYFREPMVTVRRPLMSRDVLDLTSVLPRSLRVDKVVLLEMLKAKMPAVERPPSASAHSLIDWDRLCTSEPVLRRWLETYLDVDRVRETPVGEMLDVAMFRSVVGGFLGRRSRPVSRAPSFAARVFSLRRRLSPIPLVGRLARRAEPTVKRWLGVSTGPGLRTVLFRIALLVLLREIVDAGELDPGVDLQSSAPPGAQA